MGGLAGLGRGRHWTRVTFSSGNGEVLFCFPFSTRTHMIFPLWSQRLMFTNFAVDGRRHYAPQTTRRRSLRGDAAVDKAAMWLVWLVSFLLFPFYRDLTCAALLPWSQRPRLSYCDNEGRGSGSAGLLAAALVEPELLASTGLLL